MMFSIWVIEILFLFDIAALMVSPSFIEFSSPKTFCLFDFNIDFDIIIYMTF